MNASSVYARLHPPWPPSPIHHRQQKQHHTSTIDKTQTTIHARYPYRQSPLSCICEDDADMPTMSQPLIWFQPVNSRRTPICIDNASEHGLMWHLPNYLDYGDRLPDCAPPDHVLSDRSCKDTAVSRKVPVNSAYRQNKFPLHKDQDAYGDAAQHYKTDYLQVYHQLVQ